MADVDIGLIVVACIIPVVLIFFNLVVMAHYIDPQAAGGHYIAKLMIVRTPAVHRNAARVHQLLTFSAPR